MKHKKTYGASESNGSVEKVDGGYLVSGYKYFASQSAIGNIAVTSAPYEDPGEPDLRVDTGGTVEQSVQQILDYLAARGVVKADPSS